MMVPLAPLPVGLHRCRRGLGRWMPLAFEERGSEATKRRGGGPAASWFAPLPDPPRMGGAAAGRSCGWPCTGGAACSVSLAFFLAFLLAFLPWGQQVDMRTTLDGWE